MDDISIPNAAQPIAGDKTIDAAWYRALSKLSTFANSLQRSVGDQSDGLGTKAAKGPQDWSESFVIEFPDDGDYVFPAMGYAATWTDLVTECDSGTCNLQAKIGSTALGDGTKNAVSTTRDTKSHSTHNAMAKGDDLVFSVDTNSSCERMSVTLKGTRTLA